MIITINPIRIRSQNWHISHIVEDVRRNSPTKGEQFKIVDHGKGWVDLEKLFPDERVKADRVFSQIIDLDSFVPAPTH